jgi:glycerol-3-phosphate O-acyltransferase
VVAAAAFQQLRTRTGSLDLFALLRHRDDVEVTRAELAATVDELLGELKKLDEQGKVVLGATLRNASGEQAIDAAMRAFLGYHTEAVLTQKGDKLLLSDTRLLFYYQNRLAGHGLAVDHLSPKTGATTRKIA